MGSSHRKSLPHRRCTLVIVTGIRCAVGLGEMLMWNAGWKYAIARFRISTTPAFITRCNAWTMVWWRGGVVVVVWWWRWWCGGGVVVVRWWCGGVVVVW